MSAQIDASTCIKAHLGRCLEYTSLRIGTKVTGKVRDVYQLPDCLVLVTTDRVSAFDRVLASIPFKGAVLNGISAYWFAETQHIIPNHIISTPHPNVAVVKRCVPYKVEVVVRAYLTGTTSTSIWTQYAAGKRTFGGVDLPEGMRKNERLPSVILTPTTKDDLHDRPIEPSEIIASGLMTQEEWAFISTKALELFRFASSKALERGLMLVDTKYEFGRDPLGEIIIIDEIHTPDSSRYWLVDSYEHRLAAGLEPENIDKEFLRLWFRDRCDPYKDEVLPPAPEDLILELARRYVVLYEAITGKAFDFPSVSATYDLANLRRSLEGIVPIAPRTCLLGYDSDASKEVIEVLAEFSRTCPPHLLAVELMSFTTRGMDLSLDYIRSSDPFVMIVAPAEKTHTFGGYNAEELTNKFKNIPLIWCGEAVQKLSGGQPTLFASSAAAALVFVHKLLAV